MIKSVKFADKCAIKLFSYDDSVESITKPLVIYRLDYSKSNVSHLTYKLSQSNFVQLCSVKLKGSWLYASVLVKNIGFCKKVIARYTTDSWRSFDEISCEYSKSINNTVDSFAFSVNIKNIDKIMFCLRYVVNGNVHWDNNAGQNYSITVEKNALPSIEEMDLTDEEVEKKKVVSVQTARGSYKFQEASKDFVFNNILTINREALIYNT
jgi:hypothetical protein